MTEAGGEPVARASLASVDARVARLESAQSETDRNISLIQLEQTHLRELMTSRFAAIEGGLSAQSQKLDQFISRIDSLMLEATRNAGDLSASPVGRAVGDRLVKLEAKADIADSFIDQFKGTTTAIKWAIGTSGIGLVAAIVAIAKAFGG